MSASTSGDVSLINDEDTLRKMWQDTEDFGRKKEIRAHMYKLREARLREFYNSGEVKSDIQRTSTTTTESKSCSASTHADALADHSFISMKTKEIRDSESPTKDDIYRVTGAIIADKEIAKQGWNVVTSNKRSEDGKTYTTSKVASSSGTEKIDGGQLDYAAKNEQRATVYKDGDDENFTKAIGATSNTVIKQAAVGGDENSSFKSSSTKMSSSSKYVSEQRSTYDDTIDIPSKMITQQNNDYLVSKKTYTDNIPAELKKHPSYVEGKTKITQETKTLPDGSTITTTKYEIRGGTSSQSVKSRQHSSTEQRSSATSLRSSQAVESKTSQNESKTTKYISEQPSTTETIQYVCDFRNEALQPATTTQSSRSLINQQVVSSDTATRTSSQDSKRETSTIKTDTKRSANIDESQNSNRTTTVVKKIYDSPSYQTDVKTSSTTTTTTTAVDSKGYNVRDELNIGQNTDDCCTTKVVKEQRDFRNIPQTHQTSNITIKKSEIGKSSVKINKSDSATTNTTLIRDVCDVKNQIPVLPDDSTSSTIIKTTVTKSINDYNNIKDLDIDKQNKIQKHDVSEHFIISEKRDNQQRMEDIKSKTKHPEKPIIQNKVEFPEKSAKPQESYEVPQKRQPIKPGKSELDEKLKPTDGQYDTTYRTDYTNKRISVEVSPTHDAFARSLRAVSPDRLSKSSSPNRSFKTSNNSLRNSVSPEKMRHPSRVSPERRSTSPKKTVSNETITFKSNKSTSDTTSKRGTVTEIDSSTLTRKKSTTKPRSRSPSPTSIASDIEFIKNAKIVTDLDTNVTTYITKSRPSSLEIKNKTTKKVTERSPTSPLTDASPKKSSPRDVPRTNSLRQISPNKETLSKTDKTLKRTDTYEERCRQILGIANETNKRRSSLEKSVNRRGSITKSAPEKVSPTKEALSPTRKSPVKNFSKDRQSPEKQYQEPKSRTTDSPKISEFPSQIRRSPEKKTIEPYPEKTKATKYKPGISEFPSQIRRVSEKEPLEPYPTKKSPEKDAQKISEFPYQVRKSPEKESPVIYSENRIQNKVSPKMDEYPTYTRKTPEQHVERKSPIDDTSLIDVYPPQIRKSPEKEPSKTIPETSKPIFGTARLSPERAPETCSEKEKPIIEASKISEFPSQIRKSVEKEPIEQYPEKRRPKEEGPKISEFPSQIRRSVEKGPIEQYPEKKRPKEEAPKISEFPSQIRKGVEKEPIEQYPEKKRPIKESPKISEFPSQIRKPSEKEILTTHPEKEDSPETETTTLKPNKEKPFDSEIQICEDLRSVKPATKKPISSRLDARPEKQTLHTNKNQDLKKTTVTTRTDVTSGRLDTDTEIYTSKQLRQNKATKERKESTSSSSSQDEEVEETLVSTTTYDLEERVPVDEPLVTKKFISQLCKDDEIQRTSLTENKVQSNLNEEILNTETDTKRQTVKKDSPEKVNKSFIKNEQKDNLKRGASPTKKTTKEIKNTVVTTKIVNVDGTKVDNRISKSSTDEKLKQKNVKKTTEKITLMDIENSYQNKEDNRIHKRTHRIDDTINKQTTKTSINGSVTEKSPLKRPQPARTTEVKTKTPVDRKHQKPVKSGTNEQIEKPKPIGQYDTTYKTDYTDKKTVATTEKKLQQRSSKTALSETDSIKTLNESKPSKRHLVTTTITVTSGRRASPTKTAPKLAPKTTSKVTKKINKKSDSQIEYFSSVDDLIVDDSVDIRTEITKTSNEKITRVASKQFDKRKIDKSPVKETKTEPKIKQEKCITTKSIIINNEQNVEDIIVDLQRSKSSREPTPDRICPLPVSADDKSVPRYPDKITEPDDFNSKNKTNRISDIPISENDDVTELSRIKEVEDTSTTNVEHEKESDISLLTIDKKINKFSKTRDDAKGPKQGPAPKVERPKLEVTEDLESDECLLTVSEKVNKFITTAEQLTASNEIQSRPKSPKCQFYPDEEVNVSDKVAHFITTAQKVVTTQGEPTPKIDESSKIIDTIGTAYSNTSLSKIDVTSQTTQKEIQSKETTPTRRPSNQYAAIKTESRGKQPSRESSPKLPDSTPKSTKRPNDEVPKSSSSPVGRLRSTDTVKKAKALFENIKKDEDIFKQRDILSRPSVFEGRKLNKTEVNRKLDYKTEDEQTLKSTRLLLDKKTSRLKSPEKDTTSRRSLSPDGDIPGYMRPLDRSLRPNSPHRESINQINQTSRVHTMVKEDEETDIRQTKFGVTLKRTNSGKVVPSTAVTSTRRQTSLEQITEEEIENTFELEILEELLEKIVSYELRRKIRTQIRLVKKLISEGKLVEITKIYKKEKSPQKIVVNKSKESVQKTSEYHSSYSYSERKSSLEYAKTTRQSKSPEPKTILPSRKSPSREENRPHVLKRSESPDSKSRKLPRKSPSPENKRNVEKSQEVSNKTKLFNTQLKKTLPSSKSPEEDNTPEWVKQRNLKKVTDKTVTTSRNTATVSSKKSRSSPTKELKSTDLITSSYGVGPTDENGSPLFGLKALRTQNKTDTTKVQGTVIRSQYYSENGEEPIGEISVTKYSTDPRDLGRNEDVKTKGLTSITTTQKFGYKDTPSLKSLTSSKKKKEICEKIDDEIETKITRTNRRGSVKALSQKFIENAVETSKSERQSYPKAGLILRTSSFKESTSSGDSREGSAERIVTVKSSGSKTVSGETFLTSRSKVTGVQDVISRMKTEDIREGDTKEDVEARSLLNKFLGAQVILSGIESNVKASTTTTNAKRSSKITTTITEGGKPVTRTRIFQHPLSDEDLQTIWDEQTLRLLLEQSTDYDERRRIRSRLRQVMAEQEACTDLVEKASQDPIGTTTFEGESQLLPLLQGLLEAPDNEQTADSGTESGEDQRNGLISEVQNALDKLATNLRDDGTDITPERRSSLLQLVTKLQAGLAASVPASERRSSVQGRFRRRQRPNRHTVGVSSEELADARRLIEEISLHDLTPQSSESKISSILQKQNSESSVGQNSTSSFKPFIPAKSVVKNAVAKPFSSSNSTVSGNSSSVQTPTDSLDFLFNEEMLEKKPDFSYRSLSSEEQKISRSSSGDVSIKSVQTAVKQAAARKSTENLVDTEETDEDTTVKAQTVKTEDKKVSEKEELKEVPQQNITMQNNPIYLQQRSVDVEERINKFNSKKIKMKRANTIDIPKPLNFYEEHDDDDSDCSLPEEDYHQRRRSNYLALRGPIRVGNSGGNKNIVPAFEPKTDNDKKFLAFINKHNENNPTNTTSKKNSLWSKPDPSQGNIWNNKFGNIKTAFERASSGPVQSQNLARQFWKSADDAITAGPKYDGPKISKQSARNLRQMFEEKQKESQKLPWSTTQNDKNIVTGSLKVKAFEPHSEKTYKFVPQPLPVNKFSHAPQSAFKPIPKKEHPPNLQISKTPIKTDDKEKDLESPLFLYSPKPPMESSLKPWASSPGESRVLSLAASKFENVAHQEPVPVKPRKLSKDKITMPFQQQTSEKLTAPYLVKSVEAKNSTVKNLSGQYDHNYNGRNSDSYSTYNNTKYTSPQPNAQHRTQPIYNQALPQHNQYPGPPQQTQNYSTYSQNNASKADPQNYYSVSSRQYTPQNELYQIAPDQNISYSVTTQQFVTYPDYNQIPPQHLNHSQYPINSQQYGQQGYHNQHYPVTHSQNYEYSANQPSNVGYSSQAQNYAYPQSHGSVGLRIHPQQQITSHSSQNHPGYGSQSVKYPTQQDDYYQKQNHQDKNVTSNRSYSYRKNPATEAAKPNDNYNTDQPQQYNEPQYTSTYQYKPKIQSPPPQKLNPPTKKLNQDEQHHPKLDSQISVESVKEYNAVNSRVMIGPVSQQATTIRQKSPMNRDGHDMAAALSLKNALQKVNPKQDGPIQKPQDNNSERKYKKQSVTPDIISPVNYNYRSEDSSPNSGSSPKPHYRNMEDNNTQTYSAGALKDKEEPPKIMSPTNYSYLYSQPQRNVSPNSFSHKPREQRPKPLSPHSFSFNSNKETIYQNRYNYRDETRTAPVESLEINDHGESVVTSKFQIPVINVPQPESPRPPNHDKIVSKSESWNQICIQNQTPLHKPSPRASPNARTVTKSKSSHSLAVPKQFEAGMSKDEMAQKRKTMEAYLSGSKSPQSLSRASSNENLNNKNDGKVVKRSINRLKTSEKMSTYHQASSLSRSRTLPDIVCPDLLDESNVDKAFEALFKSST